MGYEPLTVSVESVSSKKKFPFNLFIFVFGPFEHFFASIHNWAFARAEYKWKLIRTLGFKIRM